VGGKIVGMIDLDHVFGTMRRGSGVSLYKYKDDTLLFPRISFSPGFEYKQLGGYRNLNAAKQAAEHIPGFEYRATTAQKGQLITLEGAPVLYREVSFKHWISEVADPTLIVRLVAELILAGLKVPSIRKAFPFAS
jgi:hypothetical protein